MDTRNIGGGKMRIGVDAGCLGVTDERLKVGVYQVAKNLLIELGELDKHNEYFLYSFTPIESLVMRELGPKMKNIVVTPSKGWLKIWLPLRLFMDKPNIFLALNQAAPSQISHSSYKTVGIFYDIAFEKYPGLYSYAASVTRHSQNSRNLARNADVLVAISNRTKQDLEEIYSVPSSKIYVAYPGIDETSKGGKNKQKNEYFLFVGASKKSKNLTTLIRAFSVFLEKSEKKYDLLLVGGDKWFDPEIKQSFESIPPHVRSHINVLGYISQETLQSLYRGALAFVCPSLYEGFGLPFAEAMSVGCPVIGSTRGSIPEVVGDAGILLEPYDVDGLAKAMEKVATDKKLRAKLAQRGRVRSKKYSFKTFAKAIYSAIESLA